MLTMTGPWFASVVAVTAIFPVKCSPFIARSLIKFKLNTMHPKTLLHPVEDAIAAVPMRVIGPVKIISREVNEEVSIPLATFESPLWPSTHRGAKACNEAGGLHAVVVDERMSRSVLVEAKTASEIVTIYQEIKRRHSELQTIVQTSSRYAELININGQIVGSLLYLRFEFLTGDAAGHNMVTLAADHLLKWMLAEYPALSYVSISGNFCCDKKSSAVNGILGRGKNVIAEVTLSRPICERVLKTTPEKIVSLHIKKNLLGSIVAGGLRTANAHFANMLLAFYLATGQDAANIVEGSQGMVHAEVRDDQLYFSVTLPNVIVGTVGSGKKINFVKDNLNMLGCLTPRTAGENSRRLAIIVTAAVLCGELSLLAAQTNQGELMYAHVQLERT